MVKKANQKKILVFGTFDGIHDGHRYFLNEAKKLGELFVSVASNESIITRKLKKPAKNSKERKNGVQSLKIAKAVSIGDRMLGTWSEIKKIKPDIIALGYDQKELEKALKEDRGRIGLNFEIRKIKSFMPKEMHSSILNKPCTFCTVPEIKKRTIVENNLAFAFPTNIPIVPGHILISPKRCVASFEEMAKEEVSAVFSLLCKLKTALKKTFKAEGFNIAWNEGKIAGQSVPHFHLHLLPRRQGDSGITKYEPRKFLYRPGSRQETPEKELLEIRNIIKRNL